MVPLEPVEVGHEAGRQVLLADEVAVEAGRVDVGEHRPAGEDALPGRVHDTAGPSGRSDQHGPDRSSAVEPTAPCREPGDERIGQGTGPPSGTGKPTRCPSIASSQP